MKPICIYVLEAWAFFYGVPECNQLALGYWGRSTRFTKTFSCLNVFGKRVTTSNVFFNLGGNLLSAIGGQATSQEGNTCQPRSQMQVCNGELLAYTRVSKKPWFMSLTKTQGADNLLVQGNKLLFEPLP